MKTDKANLKQVISEVIKTISFQQKTTNLLRNPIGLHSSVTKSEDYKKQ